MKDKGHEGKKRKKGKPKEPPQPVVIYQEGSQSSAPISPDFHPKPTIAITVTPPPMGEGLIASNPKINQVVVAPLST